MPGEHPYRRLRAGQRQIHEPQVNDVQRDLEAIANSTIFGGDIIKDPGGWRWHIHDPNDSFPAKVSEEITAWSPTTKAVGAGKFYPPVFDESALTLDYNSDLELIVLNATPDVIPVDRIVWVKRWNGRFWVPGVGCNSALP
jgi:hypothetical protein